MKKMSPTKIGRNDPCHCGSGKKYKHCCERKLAPAIAAPPALDDATKRELTAAISHFQAGQLEFAESACKRILRKYPNEADTLNLMGLVCLGRGEHDQAIGLLDRALSLAPNETMHSNHGLALMLSGRPKEAERSYRNAIALNEKSAVLHLRLGETLNAVGELDAAIMSFRNALKIDPLLAHAYNGLGFTFILQRNYEQASVCLQNAVRIDPLLFEAQANLGAALLVQQKLEDAVVSLRVALTLKPNHLSSLDNLACALKALNRIEESTAVYQAAYAVAPTVDRRIQCLPTIPHICESKAKMLETRESFEQVLDELITSTETTAPLAPHLYCTSFFTLAFHGLNNKSIQEKHAQLYEKMCPQLLYRAPHIGTVRPEGKRVRLGFLSRYIFTHSVSRCFSGLINSLAKRSSFEIFLISQQSFETDSVKQTYASFSGTQVQIPDDYLKARQVVADLELDFLVYQDIGMDELSYFLAFARLARHQCVMGGHPDTTGIRNVDYFLSSEMAEPPEADAHYSEKLVRLPIGAFFFEPPKVPAQMKSREELGLPAAGSLYVCPMTLQKIHPDFDEAVSRLLQADPSGRVIFFDDQNAGWEKDLQRRFDRTIPAPQRERVLFLPWIKDYADFVNLNALADVVLDPFHFGIGSTAIATFAVGTPIVTLPGEFMRGRVGLFYSRLLDVPEFVANDLDDYVAKAVRLATDREWRNLVSEKIRANSHRFYENQEAVDDLANFFVGLAQSESSRT